MGEQSWQRVWEARSIDERIRSKLARLMAADGLDTGYGSVGEDAWRGFALRSAERLGAKEGDSVFEVGSGAGAFLWPLAEAGMRVGGLDASTALVRLAREAMPEGRFDAREALALDEEPWDFVVSCGVFLYFPDEAYAEAVVRAMARKARRGVAILEVADRAKQAEALAMRRGHLGEAEYQERYRGLDHLYLDKAWLRDVMERSGLVHVDVIDQSIDGYANGAFRFNAFGAKP